MKIGVIGGGASGMMAAITAARLGATVTIWEHKSRIGNKILSTGNGKCNLTNRYQDNNCYHGTNPQFAIPILEEFDLERTIAFFLRIGVYTKNRNGYLYPYSEQASSVLDCLRMELTHLGVSIQTDCEITKIEKGRKDFSVYDKDNHMYHVDRVILSCGSKAAPNTGSDGSGYRLAKQLGIRVVKPLPSLTQLKSSAKWLKGVSGVRCDALLTLMVNDVVIDRNRGELQLVDYGLSGIPTFQISGTAARALDHHKHVIVCIDFMPDFSTDALLSFMNNRIKDNLHKTAEEMLTGLFQKKLIAYFLKESQIKPNTSCKSLVSKQVIHVVEVIKNTLVGIDSVNDFTHAQTCSGGIDTRELTSSLESVQCPGLFFTGEMIDIDGICGGYNLQWAWSSGYVAGKSAAHD